MDFSGKTYWLVGASEGLGRALAIQLDALGARVVLSARSKDRLEELAKGLNNDPVVLTVDIADGESVAAAGAALPQLDGIIFNAGVYWPMKATEWRKGDAVKMADVNLTGAFRVLDEVMPDFVARNAGHIVLVGSLSGFRGLPKAIGYGASKAAIVSLGESMYADLKGTGLTVQVANPGFIKTRLTDKNDFDMPFLMSAEGAANEIVTLMQSPKFMRSFPRLFSLLFRASHLMPDWLYFRIFA